MSFKIPKSFAGCIFAFPYNPYVVGLLDSNYTICVYWNCEGFTAHINQSRSQDVPWGNKSQIIPEHLILIRGLRRSTHNQNIHLNMQLHGVFQMFNSRCWIQTCCDKGRKKRQSTISRWYFQWCEGIKWPRS